MIIKRKSPITGEINEMNIAISATDILMIGTGGKHIRSICPHLTETEVVFYQTGKTAEEQLSDEGTR